MLQAAVEAQRWCFRPMMRCLTMRRALLLRHGLLLLRLRLLPRGAQARRGLLPGRLRQVPPVPQAVGRKGMSQPGLLGCRQRVSALASRVRRLRRPRTQGLWLHKIRVSITLLLWCNAFVPWLCIVRFFAYDSFADRISVNLLCRFRSRWGGSLRCDDQGSGGVPAYYWSQRG